MIHTVSNVTQTQPLAPSAGTSTQKTAQSKPQPAATGTDTVHLSQAAQATLAALHESRETPAQTSNEASRGDRQAQRLLAREAAAKPTAK